MPTPQFFLQTTLAGVKLSGTNGSTLFCFSQYSDVQITFIFVLYVNILTAIVYSLIKQMNNTFMNNSIDKTCSDASLFFIQFRS